MEYIAQDINPTHQEDELFHLTVRNFVNSAPRHRRILAESRLLPTYIDIDKWVEGQGLPEDISRRVQVMDFIWTHYCHCKYSQPR